MTTRNVNLLWKNFKGIRKLNTINSENELGADIAHGILLSKEKSGQFRSIRSGGWTKPSFVVGTTSVTQTVGSSLSDFAIDDLTFKIRSGATETGSAVFTFDGESWLNSDSEEVFLNEYGIAFAGDPVANDEITVTYAFDRVIRLYSANMSGYGPSEQLVAFSIDPVSSKINTWIILDSTNNDTKIKIAEFSPTDITDVADVCMVQWGDRLVMVVAFGNNQLGFVCYSGTSLDGWTQMSGTDFYYRIESISEITTHSSVKEITSVCPYRSRLAINGVTSYSSPNAETIYGIWFSEAGNPINFTMSYMSSATETSAFFIETGDKINHLEEYHGLTAFGRNRSYNITGTSQNDYKVLDLTAKGVFGNAVFTLNGQCSYVDSWAKNIFTLRDNIDGTIGFDIAIGDDIQDYLDNVDYVSVNSFNRKVRMTKYDGQCLIYDVDVGEWVEQRLPEYSRVITFLNNEYFCNNSEIIGEITDVWSVGASQIPNEDGYFSHYRTNLIWLDSQSSVKSHLYPFAIILEPNTSNDFYIKFTTDRGRVYEGRITRSGYANVATYSNDDSIPEDGSQFVDDDDDLSGRVFFSLSQTELLVTTERPPFWRYLQIDIYTTSSAQQFNISGIEAKNTVITDEMLDY
jgi:hypothetical protein